VTDAVMSRSAQTGQGPTARPHLDTVSWIWSRVPRARRRRRGHRGDARAARHGSRTRSRLL